MVGILSGELPFDSGLGLIAAVLQAATSDLSIASLASLPPMHCQSITPISISAIFNQAGVFERVVELNSFQHLFRTLDTNTSTKLLRK